MLAFSGVTYIEGRAIEYFVGVHRGDRSRFETELFRPSAQAEAAAALRARRDVIELGLIGSAWHGTGLTVVEGIRKTKELGFDTYDVFEDPLMISREEQQAIKDTCAEVGLPVRSAVCIALGLVDFVPPCGVSRSTGAGPTSTSRCSSAAATCCS